MEDAHVAVLDLRAHPGCPSDADMLARAFFGVGMLLVSPSSLLACMRLLGMYLPPAHSLPMCMAWACPHHWEHSLT